MNYVIDSDIKEPAYLQLYNYLRNDIVSGVYARGSKLPSKRTIAAETGISVITVEHALNLLSEEGYTESRQRSGVFVIYRQDDFQGIASNAIRGSSEVLQQLSHQTGDFPYSVLTKTMRRVILDYEDRILVKPHNQGCEELRTEIAAYLKRSRGISVSSERIVIGSGAEYLYGLIAQLFHSRKKIAIENPSYSKIQNVYEAMNIECDLLTMGADGILSEELNRTTANILHVTPFNSYPSAITSSISKKMEYLSWASKRDAYIVEDNYESELTISKKVEEPLYSMSLDDNIIYLNTFSKTIAPSVRVGYMLLPESLMHDFIARLGFYSCPVPTFEQYVLTELLRTGDFERHINRVRRNRRKMAGK